MVRTAHQWTGLDVRKSHLLASRAQIVELLRRQIADNRQMFWRRSQVLPERENVDVHVAKVAHDGDDFVDRLAKPEDDPGLGGNVGRKLLRQAKDRHHALVAAAGARALVEARHGFGIVIVDVGIRLEDGADRLDIF